MEAKQLGLAHLCGSAFVVCGYVLSCPTHAYLMSSLNDGAAVLLGTLHGVVAASIGHIHFSGSLHGQRCTHLDSAAVLNNPVFSMCFDD